MILSIVAAVFCIPLIIAASTAVAMEPDNYHYRTLVFDDIDCCMEYTESSHSSGYSHCCTESIVNSKVSKHDASIKCPLVLYLT